VLEHNSPPCPVSFSFHFISELLSGSVTLHQRFLECQSVIVNL
jgi:hypothetical protein